MNLLIISYRTSNATEITNTVLHKYQPENAYIISTADNSSEIDYKLDGYFSGLDILRGDYENINECKPLDKYIIATMTAYEPIIMRMLERTTRYIALLSKQKMTKVARIKETLGYDDRKRLYYLHLRYWNDFLDSRRISGVVILSMPHGIYDYIIYALCVVKKIARVMCLHMFELGTFFFRDIDDPLPVYNEIYAENEKRYADVSLEGIPLPDIFEKHYQLLSGTEDTEKSPWYMKEPDIRLPPLTIGKIIRKITNGDLVRSVRDGIHSLLASFYIRRSKRKLTRLYNNLAKTPDYSTRYIYFPLHKQPEASTCPMGDIFVDQLLAIEMLAAYLPKGAMLYIKENPLQTEYCRDVKLYSDIARIPNVMLVPYGTDTYKLIENCVAVASITGNAGLEALMSGKPAMIFGYRETMYAKGMFHISTNEECQQAVEYVFKHGAKHTMRDMRLYYKTISGIFSPVAITNDKIVGNESCAKWIDSLAAVFDPQLQL